MNTNIHWGDIFYAELPEIKNSNIQHGRRPVLIISNELNNKYSSVVNYIPLSSKNKGRHLPVHVEISGFGLRYDSIALCEQVNTIDTHRLDEKVGSISKEKISEIQKAVMVQFGMCA